MLINVEAEGDRVPALLTFHLPELVDIDPAESAASAPIYALVKRVDGAPC